MEITGLADTIRWYDENSEEYARSQGSWEPVKAIEWFLRALPKQPYILEAGCGPGRESKIFLERGAMVVGVDLSIGLLQIARDKNPSAQYVQASFLKLPLEDGTFDGVWAHASLVHLETLEDALLALKEFKRVLKAGGILFVAVKLQTGSAETEVISDSLSNHERFFRYYSEQSMQDLLTLAGFTLIDFIREEDGHGRSDVQWGWFLARSK